MERFIQVISASVVISTALPTPSNAATQIIIENRQFIAHERRIRNKAMGRQTAFASEINLFDTETSKTTLRNRGLQYKISDYQKYNEHAYLSPSSWWKADKSESMSYDYGFQCDLATGCDSCISHYCAWSNDKCLDSCSHVADTECYSFDNFPTESAAKLCKLVKDRNSDEKACRGNKSNIDCKSCITTPLSSDPAKNCIWNEEYGLCQSHCNFLGCGSSTCKADAEDDERACSNKQAQGSCKRCSETPLVSDPSKRCKWNEESRSCQVKCNFVGCQSVTCRPNLEDDDEVCKTNKANEDCESCVATPLASNASKRCKWNQDSRKCQAKCNFPRCQSSTCPSINTPTPISVPTFEPTPTPRSPIPAFVPKPARKPTPPPQKPVDPDARFKRSCPGVNRQEFPNANDVKVLLDYSAETLTQNIDDSMVEKIEFAMLNHVLSSLCSSDSGMVRMLQKNGYNLLGGSILPKDEAGGERLSGKE